MSQEIEMFLRKIPENMRPWECSVNGVKYVYPAGTEQDVPEEVAHLIDAWYAAQEQESAPSGGGGSGELVVNITVVSTMSAEPTPQYVADKTFAEIAEAVSKAKFCRAVVNAYGELLFGFMNYAVPGDRYAFKFDEFIIGISENEIALVPLS